MEPNYRYIVEKIAELAPDNSASVLDYGCGVGQIVEHGRAAGTQIYGVESFYDGADQRSSVKERGLLGDIIRELDADGKIPFEDGFFDLVISNQVFEHVENLQSVIREVARVLKPDGKLFCLFPSKGVLREVHCGIPLVHWFPKRSRIVYLWLLFFRTLGFGYHKGDKSNAKWAADFQTWLAEYTFYRSRREIKRILEAEFAQMQPLEDDYLAFRCDIKGHKTLSSVCRSRIFRPFGRQFCRRYGGLVLVTSKDKPLSRN
jgi:SAM-dependent methyltransferase